MTSRGRTLSPRRIDRWENWVFFATAFLRLILKEEGVIDTNKDRMGRNFFREEMTMTGADQRCSCFQWRVGSHEEDGSSKRGCFASGTSGR